MQLFVRALRAVDRALTVLETAAVTAALLLMVVLYFAQVVLRTAEWGGVPWFQTVSQHLVLWVGMLGASLCASQRKHIAIEIISKSVTPQGRRVVEGLIDVATVVVCVVLALIAWGYVDFLERPENQVLFEIGGLKIMRWWSLAVIPAGFLIIAFRYTKLAVERIFIDEPVDRDAEVTREIKDYERRHSSDEFMFGEEAAGAEEDEPDRPSPPGDPPPTKGEKDGEARR